MKYRKKPVVIDAIQWTGENWDEVRDFFGPQVGHPTWSQVMPVYTREGMTFAKPGHWIVRGIAGEAYPCSDEVFQATYEAL